MRKGCKGKGRGNRDRGREGTEKTEWGEPDREEIGTGKSGRGTVGGIRERGKRRKGKQGKGRGVAEIEWEDGQEY
jgi:hypothetical protein